MTRADISELKANTMACWWPSRYFPRQSPDWNGITGELQAAIDGAVYRDSINGTDEATPLARLYRLVADHR